MGSHDSQKAPKALTVPKAPIRYLQTYRVLELSETK